MVGAACGDNRGSDDGGGGEFGVFKRWNRETTYGIRNMLSD